MEFRPKIRLKRRPPLDRNLFPYETTDVPEDKKIKATFTGFTVEIYNSEDMEFLYKNGCFGKSSLARSAPSSDQGSVPKDIPEALILDLEEAFFLKKSLKVLKIFDLRGNEMTDIEIFIEFSKIKKKFLLYFILYQYLRSKMWIVKSGIKFGADFLLYKYGPEYDHACFSAFLTNGLNTDWKFIQGVQRIAETSGKNVLFLEVMTPESYDENAPENSLSDIKQFSVAYFVIDRFDYKQYAQKEEK